MAPIIMYLLITSWSITALFTRPRYCEPRSWSKYAREIERISGTASRGRGSGGGEGARDGGAAG